MQKDIQQEVYFYGDPDRSVSVYIATTDFEETIDSMHQNPTKRSHVVKRYPSGTVHDLGIFDCRHTDGNVSNTSRSNAVTGSRDRGVMVQP